MQHIMLDIETLDTAPSAVILSIGAVKFDPTTNSPLGDKFYKAITVQSNLDAGRTISGNTLSWWMKQDDQARAVFNEPRVSLDVALHALHEFFDHGDYKVWGNGADFDNVIVKHAFEMMGWKTPWEFWNNRCYRTLKATLKASKMPTFEGKHNALVDACAQALHLQTFYPEA